MTVMRDDEKTAWDAWRRREVERLRIEAEEHANAERYTMLCLIAEAVAAEREACADLVARWYKAGLSPDPAKIVAAIRKRGG